VSCHLLESIMSNTPFVKVTFTNSGLFKKSQDFVLSDQNKEILLAENSPIHLFHINNVLFVLSKFQESFCNFLTKTHKNHLMHFCPFKKGGVLAAIFSAHLAKNGTKKTNFRVFFRKFPPKSPGKNLPREYANARESAGVSSSQQKKL
jgi:hypothetical protein